MAGQHVVQTENLVVDESFEKVKRTPAGQNGPAENLTRPNLRRPTGGAKQQHDSCDGKNPNGKIEDPVLRDLALQVRNRVWLARLGRANHVMPAEYLVQHDAVKEAAQAKSKDEAGAAKRVGAHARVTTCAETP